MVLKALYRPANKEGILFCSGTYKRGIHNGFVFSDFNTENEFTIAPLNINVISSVEELDIKSITQPDIVKSTTRDEYDFGFSIIQNEIQKGHIQKAILSRKIIVEKKVDPIEFYKNLEKSYRNAHVFLVETPNDGIWIGASPETLLLKEEDEYQTMALAGTKKDPAGLWTDKEFQEQRIVTNSIIADLFRLNITPEVQELETINAGPVQHLRNILRFNADLKPETIIKALHPTPAISGHPKMQASSTIKVAENHKRSYYCGFGGLNLNNELSVFVNLRCAKINKENVELFVGGGITKESDNKKEWEECENKAFSLLKYL